MLRLVLALVLILPLPARAEDIVVFAASSMKTALDTVARDFEASRGGTDEVLISYAGSGLLAKQILAGAPADIFISANEQWMDEVAAAGVIAPGARRDLLTGALVLIAPVGTAPVALDPGLDLAALLGDGKLAMALVDAVPAGQYGKAALTSLGLWDGVAAAVAQVDNVRAALALVSTGEASYGITYASDARAEPGVVVVGTFAEDSHPPIRYPVARLRDSDAVRGFYDALFGAPARAVFEGNGFRVLE